MKLLFSILFTAAGVVSSLALVGSSTAGSGVISPSSFGGESTIVYTETYECEGGIYGLVVNSDDWSGGLSGEGSVLLDTKIIADSWDLRHPPRYEVELYKKMQRDNDFAHIKHESPEYEKLLKEAQAKDGAHKKRVLAALDKEHKRAGLNADPETEGVVYFFSGRAKMRVTETLQGDLKPGDEIEVTWKHVQRRISCPPIIPFKGKCGWVFNSKLQQGSKATLGHGFFSLEDGRKAKAECHLMKK